ncbi:hypothetical protein EV426DRAFT_646324 [Tirmania nivea]|nr:hypothetical protein EV426DRAFT_646324 [Tirmania nivea]
MYTKQFSNIWIWFLGCIPDQGLPLYNNQSRIGLCVNKLGNVRGSSGFQLQHQRRYSKGEMYEDKQYQIPVCSLPGHLKPTNLGFLILTAGGPRRTTIVYLQIMILLSYTALCGW